MHVDGSCHCGALKFSAQVDPAREAGAAFPEKREPKFSGC